LTVHSSMPHTDVGAAVPATGQAGQVAMVVNMGAAAAAVGAVTVGRPAAAVGNLAETAETPFRD